MPNYGGGSPGVSTPNCRPSSHDLQICLSDGIAQHFGQAAAYAHSNRTPSTRKRGAAPLQIPVIADILPTREVNGNKTLSLTDLMTRSKRGGRHIIVLSLFYSRFYRLLSLATDATAPEGLSQGVELACQKADVFIIST